MTTKLVQKHFLKGTHEFEIVGDQVNINIKSAFKKDNNETLSVTLAVLNPEPVITRSHLEFLSRVNGEALISLALSKPNVAEFNAFVSLLKKKAQDEYSAISGISITSNSSSTDGLELEPPEFGEYSHEDIIKHKKVNVEGLENAINMLQTYVNNDEIKPLISSLNTLIQSPEDPAKLAEVATVFNELGSSQGAVLTYAPYISIMLSDDPFGRE